MENRNMVWALSLSHHGCWWPDDAWSSSVRSHGIVLYLPEYFISLKTREFNICVFLMSLFSTSNQTHLCGQITETRVNAGHFWRWGRNILGNQGQYKYNDVIMGAIASEINILAIVYSTVYSRHRSKKTSRLHVTGLCAGNSPVTDEFPAQGASNAENVSIWWRRRAIAVDNMTSSATMWPAAMILTKWDKGCLFSWSLLHAMYFNTPTLAVSRNDWKCEMYLYMVPKMTRFIKS